VPEDEIGELIDRINERPDKLHGDYTPASQQLIAIGERALGAVLPLMLNDDPTTRLRAQRVLEGITMKAHGFTVGRGWETPIGEKHFREFWRGLGGLNWQSPRDAREKSVALWTRWLAQRGTGASS
jgi:hypothetical protein